MYHCHTLFYLIGCREENGIIFDMIKGIQPFKNFTYEFLESEVPDEAVIPKADVIFANIKDSTDFFHTLISKKKVSAELIIIAENEQISLLSDNLDVFDDIWVIPMPENVIAFRVNKWHKEYKAKKDNWLSNQYLESVINSTPNLVWFKDKDGVHHKVNNSFCKTVNKSKKQVEGRKHAYIWNVEQDDPACIESELEVMTTQKTKISEETIQTGDGKKLLTTYKSPLYDIDGSVMGTVGIAIDITKTHAYEQEIIKKNKTLETIFTTLDCGIICHSIDGSHIISINAAALKILGYESQEELMDSGFKTVAMSVMDEDKPKLRASIQKLKKENDSISVEYRVQHKNGDILHVMGNVKLLRENGELFYQRFLLDCTDQKLHEKKVREENEKHHTELIQALSEDYSLVCYFNLETENGNSLRISEKNQKEQAAIFKGDITFTKSINDYIDSFVYKEDRERLKKILMPENLKKELSSKNALYINYRAGNNEEFEFYQIKIVRIGNLEKGISIVIGFKSVDEEIRQEMEKKSILEDALVQANKANKAKSVFLSNMSHDIRTPMNAIVGFTTLALDHINQKNRVESYLNKIMLSGNHLLSLLNDILDMSHIENNKVVLTESECSLSDILHNLCDILQADVRAKHFNFSVNVIGIKNENIICDKLRINQVLLNILSNSIKYTQEGGEISVTASEKPDPTGDKSEYTFVIADTGIGMSEEFLKRIFEPFERERNTTLSGIQGTGLGMPITKKIVELMNGTIDVKSKKGVGTVITLVFTFPIIKNCESSDIPKLKNSRALIINADEEACEKISEILERLGLRADWTRSEKNAIIRTRQAHSINDKFDVYIIDQSNDINGIEITKRLRQEEGAADSIVILTTYDSAEIEDKSAEAGVDVLCRKPLFPDDIKKSLLSALEKSNNGGDNTENRQTRHGRILLVEDNELNSEIAIAILTDAGYTVEYAENGQAAVEMVKKSQPGYYQVILMDIQMPIMNGFEASSEIRKLENKELASIPILAMTANAFEEDKREALKCGMNGHIAKPIDIKNLFEVLDEIL